MQDSYRNILDIMEQNHEKLFKAVKKKIGMQKTVFDAIVQSGDMFEWSVPAALEAAHKHDTKVIQEADSDDECTQMHQSILEDRIPLDDVHDLSGQISPTSDTRGTRDTAGSVATRETGGSITKTSDILSSPKAQD